MHRIITVIDLFCVLTTFLCLNSRSGLSAVLAFLVTPGRSLGPSLEQLGLGLSLCDFCLGPRFRRLTESVAHTSRRPTPRRYFLMWI